MAGKGDKDANSKGKVLEMLAKLLELVGHQLDRSKLEVLLRDIVAVCTYKVFVDL